MITAYESNGAIYLQEGALAVPVAGGTRPVLVGSVLWWLQGTSILSADVESDLQIANQATFQLGVSGFMAKEVGDRGTAVAYIKDENLYLQVSGITYTLAWDSARETDFDFSFSADLQMLSVVYRIAEGNTTQAYLVQFVFRNDNYVVTDALFRVFDFRLGARALDENAAGLVA